MRGGIPKIPGGNEGEPTWWEKYGQAVWDMPFTLVDIEGEKTRQSKEFQEGVSKSGVPDRGVYAGMDAEELISLKKFLQPLKDHLGAENDLTLLSLFDLLRGYAGLAAIAELPKSGINLFLKEIAKRFLVSNPQAVDALVQDKDFWNYCELDPDSSDFSLSLAVIKSDTTGLMSSYIRDKIIEGLLRFLQ